MIDVDAAGMLTALTVAAVGLGGRSRIARPRRPRPHADAASRPRRTATRSRRAATIGAVGTLSIAAILIVGVEVAVMAAIPAVLSRAVRPLLRARRCRRDIDAAFPEAIDLLVHAVRAGSTPYHAVRHLAEVAPTAVRPAFAAVVHRTERGQVFADAIRALPDELGTSASAVADVIATTDRYGLPLAPVLDQLGREARDARRRQADASARRLPVRLAFPLVTCTLPSFVLLAIAPALIASLSSLGGSPL